MAMHSAVKLSGKNVSSVIPSSSLLITRWISQVSSSSQYWVVL